jgi:DNA invertase Pin-like site-specific DNA recombinase
MKTAYSYVRFSSKRQEKGDSVRRQLALARDYATKHALILDERSYEDLGISAFKGKNLIEGALGAFIKAVDDGLIQPGSYLVVESLDRVSRAEVIDALDTFMSIVKRNIVLVTLNDGQQYTRANITENWTKLIMALAVMARANEESETKAKRVRAKWQEKKNTGVILTSQGPSWLALKNGKWVHVPEKVKTVRHAFDLAAKNFGTPTIADRLNADPQHPPLGGRAEFWTPELVMALLRNRSVVGDLVSRQKNVLPIPRYYPEIIKLKTFNLVQAHIEKRRRTGGPKGDRGYSANLLSGRLFCECGSKMRYVSSNPPHVYVQCLKAYSKQGCDARKWNYTVLEETLLEHVFDYRLADARAFTESTEPDVRSTTLAEIAQKETTLNNLIKVAGEGRDFAGGTTALSKAIEKVQAEIDDLQQSLRTAAQPVSMGDYIDAAIDLHEEHKRLKAKGGPAFAEVRAKVEGVIRQLLPKVVLEKQAKPLDFNTPNGATESGIAYVHERGGRIEQMSFHLPPQGFQKGNRNGKRPTP